LLNQLRACRYPAHCADTHAELAGGSKLAPTRSEMLADRLFNSGTDTRPP